MFVNIICLTVIQTCQKVPLKIRTQSVGLIYKSGNYSKYYSITTFHQILSTHRYRKDSCCMYKEKNKSMIFNDKKKNPKFY